MPTTDRTIKSPIVNILTKAQYNAIATPSEDEFYLITDDSDETTKKTTYTIQGDGTSTSFEIPHSYNTIDVIVQVYDNEDYSTVYCDVTRTNNTKITISFAEPPASNKSYTVMMIA